MPQKISDHVFYFDESRLRMTLAGRVLARVVRSVAYLVLVVATFTLLLSYDIRAFLYLGLFFLLVIMDILIHYRKGDVSISLFLNEPLDNKINLALVLNRSAFSTIERAVDRSVITKKNFLLELARRLLELPQVENALRRLEVKPEEFKQKLEALMAEPAAVPSVQTSEDYIVMCELLATHAFTSAIGAGHDFITPNDLFSGLARMGDESLDRLFALFSISPADIDHALIFSGLYSGAGLFGHNVPPTLGGFAPEGHRGVQYGTKDWIRQMYRMWMVHPTPELDRYGIDLTHLARAGRIGFLVGRDAEYEQLVEAVARPLKPAALLVGNEGVGKEAIVQYLAASIARGDVPEALLGKRVVSLQWQSLVADTPSDAIAARLKTITAEISAAQNIILYVPDVHNFLRTAGAAYLTANNFPVIGATHLLSDHPAGVAIITVNEITEAEAEKVLVYEGFLLERSTHLSVNLIPIKRAVALAKKHAKEGCLPLSAEALLKDAFTSAEHRAEKGVTSDRVVAVAEEKLL